MSRLVLVSGRGGRRKSMVLHGIRLNRPHSFKAWSMSSSVKSSPANAMIPSYSICRNLREIIVILRICFNAAASSEESVPSKKFSISSIS
ncbi:MAG: hypothetical protein ACTSUE_17175 [Promethearchaeota archaeon]